MLALPTVVRRLAAPWRVRAEEKRLRRSSAAALKRASCRYDGHGASGDLYL